MKHNLIVAKATRNLYESDVQTKPKENIFGEEDVFFWLGVWFWNQTFEDEIGNIDTVEIRQLLNDENEHEQD